VQSDVQLTGKTVLITGANTGLGYETSVDLARRGARIIMACRDMKRAETAKANVRYCLFSDRNLTASSAWVTLQNSTSPKGLGPLPPAADAHVYALSHNLSHYTSLQKPNVDED